MSSKVVVVIICLVVATASLVTAVNRPEGSYEHKAFGWLAFAAYGASIGLPLLMGGLSGVGAGSGAS